MPRRRYSSDDPREWLNRAESNLAYARTPDPQVYFEDRCFNAQQAAEKALKALLLDRRGRFPYIHDVGELLNLLSKAGETIPADVQPAEQLTDFAVESRYPGLFEPLTEEDYQEALDLATRCVQWVRERLGESNL